MERFLFKTEKGVEVELNENEMHLVHQHYMEQATADYLRENHEKWSEEKVQEIALETRRQMLKYAFTEEEAIEEALKAYEEEHSAENMNTAEYSLQDEANRVNGAGYIRHRGR